MKKRKRRKQNKVFKGNFPIDLSDHAVRGTLSMRNDDNFCSGVKRLKDGMQAVLINVEGVEGIEEAFLIELI
jgi:hypothetical protein